MSPSAKAPGKFVSMAWAASAALIIEAVVEVRWWHPYCNAPTRGPGFTAFGFPLPYAQATGHDLDYVFMPVALAANLLIIALLCLPAMRFALARLQAKSTALAGLAKLVGPALLATLVGLYASFMAPGFKPVATLGSDGESYGSYRPMPFAVGAGDKACYI